MGSFTPSCQYSEKLVKKLRLINLSLPQELQIDLTMVQKAIYFAKKYHGAQKRDSGEPFYSHPLEVAYMLAEYSEWGSWRCYRTDLLVTAILHDTLEDTELSFEEIVKNFGERVACQVEGLTRIKTYGKISSAELVDFLLRRNNKDLLLVKLFDRLHNIQTLKAKSPEKIIKVLDETIKTFLTLSVYLDIPQVKNVLIRYCYEYLHLHQGIYCLTGLSSELVADRGRPSMVLYSQSMQKNGEPFSSQSLTVHH